MQRIVVLGALSLVLIFGLAFFCAVRPNPGHAAELAELAPVDSVFFMAVDTEEQLDVDGILEDLESAVDRQEMGISKEAQSLTPREWWALFEGRAFVAVDSQKRVMGAVDLADAQDYENWWRTQRPGGSFETREVGGVTFEIHDGVYIGHDTEWLYLAESEEGARRVLQSVKREGESLADNPRFLEAKKNLKTPLSGGILFADATKILESLEPNAKMDQYTIDSLKDIHYFVATVDMSTTQTDAYLKITGNTALGKQLLTPGQVSGETLEEISNRVATVHVVDGKWLLDTGFAIAGIIPEFRSKAPLARIALMVYGDPTAAFTGEVAVAGAFPKDLQFKLAPFQNTNMIMVAGIRDFELAHQMIVEGLPTASVPPDKGKQKIYPLPLGGKSAFILKRTKRPVAILNIGFDELHDTSGGSIGSARAISKLRTWAGDGALYIGYLDVQGVFGLLLEEFKKEADEDTERQNALLEKLGDRFPTSYETAGVTVRENGIYLRATGLSPMVIWGTALAMVPGALGYQLPDPTRVVSASTPGGQVACKSNLKNLGIALEMYSTDYSGRYPDRLNVLTPNYLKTIPECPSAGEDTYSQSYLNEPPKGHGIDDFDGYQVHCSGHHHSELPIDRPAYNSLEGLISP